MHVGQFRLGAYQWIVPVLLGITVPLLYATLPGGPVRMLAMDVNRMQTVHAELRALGTLTDTFARVRAAEQDAIVGQSNDGAVADLRRAMKAFPDDYRANVNALRTAMEAYSQTNSATGESVARARETVSMDTLDGLPGLLSTPDESRLREAMRGMRLAEMEFASEHDQRSLDKRARWADVFTQRLEAMALPTDTRVRLAEAMAMHWRVMPPERISFEADKHQETALTIDAAMAVMQSALAGEETQLRDGFRGLRYQLCWLLGICLVACALAISAGVSVLGRLLLARTVDQGWSPQ